MSFNLKLLSFLLALVFTGSTYAQKENNLWYFGNNAGMDFSGGSPISITGGKLIAAEGCATISDSSGNLLFYTDGYYVWDKSHQLMPNGIGLAGGTGSSTQAALILPKAKSGKQFYIFTVDEEAGLGGLSYSLVDLDQNAGLGDVVEKNTPLVTPTCEKITAVRHCNGKDVWIITHLLGNNAYAAFLVTDNGVQSTPVISRAGSVIKREFGTFAGQLKASLDGKKLAAAHGTVAVELMDFDPATGIVTNAKTIFRGLGFAYGVEFSPSGSMLYLSVYSSFDLVRLVWTANVYQYDLSLNSEEAIQRSRATIFTTDEHPYQIDAFQLGPDGKIYIIQERKKDLVRINSPEKKGAECNYEAEAVKFTTELRSGLPTVFYGKKRVDSILAQTDAGFCPSVPIRFSSVLEAAGQQVLWNFGDPQSGAQNTSSSQQPVHAFTKAGVYTISLIKYNACGNDTLIHQLTIGTVSLDLGKDTSFCEGTSYLIRATSNVSTLKWQDGSTTSTFSATKPGMYWVEASNTIYGCTSRDTIQLTVRPAPQFELGDPIMLCRDKDTVLNVEASGAEYLWSDGSQSGRLIVNKPASIWVQVKKDGCTSADTVVVRQIEAPVFSLGDDLTLCSGQELTLSVNVDGALYRWNDQSTGRAFTVRSPGTYFVDVVNKCGMVRDSVIVSQGACSIFIPSAFTPDGNGLNDVFVAKGTGNITSFHMVIYDRWGGVVFSTTDKHKPWNGYKNGVMAPVGTYAYVIRYRDHNELQDKFLKGTITLIR